MPLFHPLQRQDIGFSGAFQLVVNLVCYIGGVLRLQFFWAEEQMCPP